VVPGPCARRIFSGPFSTAKVSSIFTKEQDHVEHSWTYRRSDL
jgi:hypothetical protein